MCEFHKDSGISRLYGKPVENAERSDKERMVKSYLFNKTIKGYKWVKERSSQCWIGQNPQRPEKSKPSSVSPIFIVASSQNYARKSAPLARLTWKDIPFE
nr:hypothetical protein L204_00448 [Cryptococcus depauperatus CBS 7855]